MGNEGFERGQFFHYRLNCLLIDCKNMQIYYSLASEDTKCVLQVSRGSTDVQRFSLGKPGVIPQHVLQISPGGFVVECVFSDRKGEKGESGRGALVRKEMRKA